MVDTCHYPSTEPQLKEPLTNHQGTFKIHHCQLVDSWGKLCFFVIFCIILTEKDVILTEKNIKSCFSIKKFISTSERHAEHLFAGRNTQQERTGLNCLGKIPLQRNCRTAISKNRDDVVLAHLTSTLEVKILIVNFFYSNGCVTSSTVH